MLKASVATNDIKTETPAEPTVKSTPAEKPKSVPTKAALKETPCLPSQDSQDLSSKDDATPSVSDCDNSKENDNVDKVNDKDKKKDISGDIFDQLLSGEKSTTEKESTAENQEVNKLLNINILNKVL